ncbi:hypothetical protein [Paraburkholderia fynbosensis]|nr:hypothetical protein [Paraburkholderia fynbosensis]
MYPNCHYISVHNVARAVIHLLQISLYGSSATGIDAFNIADTASPTYKEVYDRIRRQPLFYVPLVFDLIKGFALGKCISPRLPMGLCRLDNWKLRSTGFEFESDMDGSLGDTSPSDGSKNPPACMR